jgi:hypothetical protein
MAHDRKIKTEATGKSRWCPRAEAKKDSNVKRRHDDKKTCQEGRCTQTTVTDASGSLDSSLDSS